MTDVADLDPPVSFDEPDFIVIARNPVEMAAAQQAMIAWAENKLRVERELCDEAQAQLDIALKQKWRASGWRKRLALSEKKLDFYQKLRMAFEAGYYIVPPFPLDIFAVRVDRNHPRWRASDNKYMPHEAEILPVGEGQYVSRYLEVGKNDVYGRKPDGTVDYGTIVRTWYQSRDFQEVDFPFKLAKVEVLDETAKAFALKIFDQFGVLPKSPTPVVRTRRDPIVCGQILAPHKNREPITFFIAWWLDTRTL